MVMVMARSILLVCLFHYDASDLLLTSLLPRPEFKRVCASLRFMDPG